ncbi:hypothetical protein [Paenarthrobacter nicotinovorans]|uniref:hypothetical protein n=1 Tax=Paenarthrobacter nicotinovorans TaxID=29320 RepID=UPI0011A8E0EF|nr:hypothetical protein [Paenarthrobacter nicotinovorans]
MDTSGLYPQMLPDTPLYEVADYTAALKTALSPRYKNITGYGSLYKAYGAPFTVPRWVREGKMIKLEGLIGTTQTTISMNAAQQYDLFTIPLEPTPVDDKMFMVPTTPQMGYYGIIYVRKTGMVQFWCNGFTNVATTNFAIGLDNITYYANTSGFTAV